MALALNYSQDLCAINQTILPWKKMTKKMFKKMPRGSIIQTIFAILVAQSYSFHTKITNMISHLGY